MTSDVVIDTSKLDAIIAHSGRNARRALRDAAFAVERFAKQKAPVDTGALRASIYVSMEGEGSQLPQVLTDAERVSLPMPEGPLVAYVGPSVHYGIYQELGTRRMAAQPYLLPAVRMTEQLLRRIWRRVATDE